MIVDYNESIKLEVIEFLNKIEGLKIDYDILNNSVIYKNDFIEALMSFEQFNKYGVIRYFVFKREINEELIYNLFKDLIKKAKALNIKYLVSITLLEIKDLFISLGFLELLDVDVFLGEELIFKKNNKNKALMVYNIDAFIDF